MEQFEKGNIRFDAFDMSGQVGGASAFRARNAIAHPPFVCPAARVSVIVGAVLQGRTGKLQETCSWLLCGSLHAPRIALIVQSIIFVVDSADKVRMVVAKDELDALLSHEDVAERPVPLLIFANKTDKASALPLVEVISLLGLQDISGRAWKVQCVDCVGSHVVRGGPHSHLHPFFAQAQQRSDRGGCRRRHRVAGAESVRGCQRWHRRQHCSCGSGGAMTMD